MLSEKIIITVASTGSSLSPSMSDALPYLPEDIARQSIDAVKAGAAIVHLHARDPATGRPTNDCAVWSAMIGEIRAGSDALINMSASLGSAPEDRLSAVLMLRPDYATVIVGSMNYGLFRKVENQKATAFAHDWEKELYGPSSYEIVTNNSFKKIDRMIEILIDNDIGIEFECYDVGHLYILDYHLSRRTVRSPIVVQFLTGILGGIGSDVDHLLHMKRTAERLFGRDLRLFIHGTGTRNLRTAMSGALMGTHIRVGQEDSLIDMAGKKFASNAEQVQRVRQALEMLNYQIANADEARSILSDINAHETKLY